MEVLEFDATESRGISVLIITVVFI